MGSGLFVQGGHNVVLRCALVLGELGLHPVRSARGRLVWLLEVCRPIGIAILLVNDVCGPSPLGVCQWFCYGGFFAALGVVVPVVPGGAWGHLVCPCRLCWKVQERHAQLLARVLGEEEASQMGHHIESYTS